MSEEITQIENTGRSGRTMTLTQFSGGFRGPMLQVTQGPGTAINFNMPGFIHLKRDDAMALIVELTQWVKDTIP